MMFAVVTYSRYKCTCYSTNTVYNTQMHTAVSSTPEYIYGVDWMVHINYNKLTYFPCKNGIVHDGLFGRKCPKVLICTLHSRRALRVAFMYF